MKNNFKASMKLSGGIGIGIAGGRPYSYRHAFVIIIEFLLWEICLVWPDNDNPE